MTLHEQLNAFVLRERALHEARGKGGQSVGRSPSVSPSVLRELERMLEATSPAAEPPDHRCPEIGPDTLQGAFVACAQWWEYKSTGGTMWASDRDEAWAEAKRRYGAETLERERQEAEAEVRRLREALEAIAQHNGARFALDADGYPTIRQPTPQAMAASALRGEDQEPGGGTA